MSLAVGILRSLNWPKQKEHLKPVICESLFSVIKVAILTLYSEGRVAALPPENHICTCSQALLPVLQQISRQIAAANTRSDAFYRNIGTVAVLGSSISFALIVTQIADPKTISQHGKFDLSTTRILLAISWVLFMVVLNFSFSFGQTMPGYSRGVQTFWSKIVYLVELAAVIFLSLVVAAYVEVVGYVAVGLASTIAICVVLEACT